MYHLLVAVLTTIVGIITFFKWRYSYWKSKNVPCIESSIPFGSTQNPYTRTLSDGKLTKIFYNKFKKMNTPHGSFYNFIKPIYLPIDPQLVQNILQKDFTHFVDRGVYHNEEDDPLSAHLFALSGEKWRTLRAKLTPTFTSGKIKMMFDTLVRCSKPMKSTMDKFSENKIPVDIKDIVARFATDVIGSCAFGLECNSFEKEDSEFRKYGERIFQRSTTFLESLTFFIIRATPEIGRLLRLPYFQKDVRDFFLNAIRDTVNNRKKNVVVRNDMLQLLIDMKDKETNEPVLSVEEMAAQAMIFFIGGFETSSSAMSFCLMELGRNPDVQEKARIEINNVLKKYNNEITYDALMEMKYLTQVIEETLRIYPPLTVLKRECVKDYRIPRSDVTIEKGTLVFIPVLGLHHDAEHYPDPEKFDPDRFSEKNKKHIHPFTYLPFGEGPRICIGLRFGIMQIKLGLSVLLKNYRFSLSTKTRFPIEYALHTVMHSTKNPIWLDVEQVY